MADGFERMIEGRELRARREALRLSRADVAALTEVSEASLWSWESGNLPRRRSPKLDGYRALLGRLEQQWGVRRMER